MGIEELKQRAATRINKPTANETPMAAAQQQGVLSGEGEKEEVVGGN